MLFKRELKRNLKSFLVTSFICSVMIAYMVSMSKSMGADIQQIIDFKLPKQMQAAFGMTGLDYSKPESIFALAFSYIYLFIAIYIAGVFSTIVSKEFSEKTAEFLFSLPAKRLRILFTKLSVAFLYLLLTTIVIFFVSWLSVSIQVEGDFNLKLIFLLSYAWFLGGFTFGAITFLISSFNSYSKAISSISVGFVMVMYLLQVVISVNDKLENLKYISPFDWFKGSEIANNLSISSTYSLIALAVIIISITIGIRRYNKMDVLI